MAGKGTNMTRKEIKAWKTNSRKAVNKLVTSLNNINSYATKLSNVTATAPGDEDELAQAFDSIATATEISSTQLSSNLNTFEEKIDKYLETTKNAENTASTNVKKVANKTKDIANNISKLGK